MPQMLRVCPILVLLVFFIAGCAAYHDATGGGVCAGEPNPQSPIVCVDDSVRTLTVNPDPITIDDVQGGQPITLVWKTESGRGDLQVEMKDPGCVTDVNCPGNGRCTARSIPGASKSCKYDVWINGGNHDRLDPTVVIQPCCGG